MTRPVGPLSVLLVSGVPADAEDVRSRLAGCRVTLSPGVAEAAPASAWHDVVVLVDRNASQARELRDSMSARASSAPLLVLLPAGADADHDARDSGADAVLVRDAAGQWAEMLRLLLQQLAARAEDRLARERAEAELGRQRALIDGFLNRSPGIAYLKDGDGRYQWVNSAFERWFQVEDEDWRGRTDTEIWGEEAGAKLRENDLTIIAAGEMLEVEETVPTDDGPQYWLAFKFPLDDDQGRTGIGGMAVDVTSIRRAEEERRHGEVLSHQARRLESLGSLASSLAHDFNNLLVTILCNAGLAVLEAPDDSNLAAFLDEIERSAMKAADLTHHLLAVTGRASLLIERVPLQRFLDSRAFALRAGLPRHVKLHVEADADAPPVLVDPSQLEQILQALVGRAAGAMGDEPGSVTVRATSSALDADVLAGMLFGETLSPGPHVLVEIEDDGPVPENTELARLLEPDFEAGSPGLAAVLGLVRGHGGAIGVEPAGDRGTRVRIALVPAPQAPASDDIPTPPATQGATVLVVDDDEMVRSVARAALQRFGWNALVAKDGTEALRIFESMGDQISAVLLDATMPGLSGYDVLARMKARIPTMKVVLSSGFPEDKVLATPGARLADAFLAKPYRPARLLSTIRALVEDDGEV